MPFVTLPGLVDGNPISTAHMNDIKSDIDYLESQIDVVVDSGAPPAQPIGLRDEALYLSPIYWTED